ncbi:MAG TPA: MFS transporter [Opitutaceae bacterium]|nr:MFS transporter [Opitutaceae bacterium]
MRKIETHHPRVPWSWVTWMTLPWISFFYIENISSVPLTFTLRKFIDNPGLIAFVGSLNVAFNFIVGMVTSYMSDRIWTPLGRRRPFLIAGWAGLALALFFVPLAENVWTLVALIVIYQFCADIAKPLEPLFNEVVPPAQRGRAATIRSVGQSLMNIVFLAVLVAQFDRLYHFEFFNRSTTLSGEALLYWIGCAALLAAIAVLFFFVRETPPPATVAKEPFVFRRFFHDVFGQRQWWNVYLLYSVPIVSGAGIGLFDPLLRTEQLGFAKSQYGWAATAGTVLNLILFIPAAGFLTDRVPRLVLLRFSIIARALLGLAFFIYLRFAAHYSIPFVTLIVFDVSASAFSACIALVWGPLVYDYIPSERFGTVSAGLSFVSGIAPFVLTNLAGVWVGGFTSLFGPQGRGTHDYSSIYILQLLAAGAALALIGYLRREERAGRLVRLGADASLMNKEEG